MPFRSAFSQLFTQDTSIAAAVFFLVAVALGAAVLLGRRRRRRGQEPSLRAEANPLEAGYVALLVAIVAFLMVIGTNATFIPFFFLGYGGLPRWVVTYPAGSGFPALQLISSIGAGVIGLAMTVFAYNLWISARVRVPAPPDPWGGYTLEWATSSPPPPYNFDLAHPVPPVRGYAPLFDLREQGLARAAPQVPTTPQSAEISGKPGEE